MGLALKVKLFAIAVALFVQESAGYNTTPFPANFSASPPIESPPDFFTHGKPIDTPSPASQPNGSVFHGSPVLPPLSSSPVGPVSVASPSSYSPQMPPTIRPTVPGSMPPSPDQSKTPEYMAPITKPMAPEPDVSPVSTPPSSINSKRDGMPVAAPPNETRNQFSPMNPSQREAPSIHKASRHATDASPLSSPKSPLHMWSHSPLSLPFYKRHYRKENITSHTPSSLLLPPAPSQLGPMIPPTPIYPPKSQPKGTKGHHAHRHVNPVSPFGSPLSPSKSHVSPAPSPYPTAPSGQTKLPFLSPKNSPFGSSPRNPTTPLLPPIKVLPPPPPNEDCSSLTCPEPLTNTPPGSACGCVWPMQVALRLSVAIYTFFPLVSELAEEIAVGVFMKQSQVRIMGANAARQDPQKTIVLIDLVPLGEKIDNTTAYLTFQRFWHKQVVINSSFFGGYEVLYVRYPGLPPSPPSSINVIDGQPYTRNGNNGGTIQPLGVDVRKGQHKDGLSGSIVAIIILSASTAVILCCAVAWLFLFKHRVCQEEPTPLAMLPSLSKPSGIAASMFGSGPSSSSLSVGSSMAMYTGSAKTFSSTDLERATDNFNASRIVGEGGFGRVYSGVLEDGTKVAVKVLKRDDQQGGREFLSEVEMLSRLHHRNLVKLIGICTEEHTRCLVYELIPNGSVESHLHGVDKKTAPLDWGARMKIALGSARGLAYLHEDSNPRVIHRDFKSSNILLEHDFTPKVSDFGLARTAMDEENKHVSTRVMGTFGYVAPEYAMTGHLLVKSDVYSYGVVLLELLTGRKPIDMSQPPGQENLVTWLRPLLTSKQGLESIIDPSLGPGSPFDSIAKVSAIASMCVQQEVSNRPFMGEVVQALKLVCNECNETKEFGSTSSSLEDICIDMDARISTNSVSHLLSTSTRLGMQQDLGSFRRHSSSGSLIIERGTRLLQKMRRLSGGTVSEHRAIFRLWPGSH